MPTPDLMHFNFLEEAVDRIAKVLDKAMLHPDVLTALGIADTPDLRPQIITWIDPNMHMPYWSLSIGDPLFTDVAADVQRHSYTIACRLILGNYTEGLEGNGVENKNLVAMYTILPAVQAYLTAYRHLLMTETDEAIPYLMVHQTTYQYAGLGIVYGQSLVGMAIQISIPFDMDIEQAYL